MTTLLEKTRRVNRLVQKLAGHAVDFDEMAGVLSDVINANVYIVDGAGTILGHALVGQFECPIVKDEVVGDGHFPEDYSHRLLRVEETSSNIAQEGRKCVFKREEGCIYGEKLTTIVPITGGGQRLGTLILARFGEKFDDADLILAEYGATAVAMEVLRARSERVEVEARKKAAVQVAIGSLSYSELEAVQHIFEELPGPEGFLVASRIADRVGITRSVIVNALRKFESAGVIESRSLGMKGTYIKVLNSMLVDELKRMRS
ncbi:MAG: GTP-sensing pleiotropic transcriptional regulator CodY [Bacillota bacterium]